MPNSALTTVAPSVGKRRAATDRRIFGLDVVRAAAILSVWFSHVGFLIPAWRGLGASHPILTTGWVGVELFFVLSGYLIGGLLLDIALTAPSLANLGIFLTRRWMRTLPLYFVWLAVSAVWFPPTSDIFGQVSRYAVFLQNFAWAMPSYWFGVSWSLAVEEWFYLLFSTVLVLCALIRPSLRGLLLPILLFLVVPVLLRWYRPDAPNWDEDVRKVVILRLDAACYGVLLAWLRLVRPACFGRPGRAAAAGLITLIGGWIIVTWDIPGIPRHLLQAASCSVLDLGAMLCVLAAATWRHASGRLAGLVRWISDISYGLYLFHLTILVACESWIEQGKWPLVAAGLVSPFLLAHLSRRYLEGPLLTLRPRQQRPTAPTFGLASRKMT